MKKLILQLSVYLFILCVVWYGVYLIRHNARQAAQEARGEVITRYIDKRTGL
jgi:hypothetical protein